MICAFRLDGTAPGEVDVQETGRSPDQASFWIHANIGHVGFLPWLCGSGILPEDVLEVFSGRETRHRLEIFPEGFLLVGCDFSFDDPDPGEVGPLWVWLSPRLLLTARLHSLRTPDQLRVSGRAGTLPASSAKLFLELVESRIKRVEELCRQVEDGLDGIEDSILRDHATGARDELGRHRRLATALRRHFRPEVQHLRKLLARAPSWLEPSCTHRLEEALEDLSHLVEEASHQLESAKLLQEELSARDTEATGRNLYVLTIFTVAFLPMTLISGIFGMNLPGMPWGGHPLGFWWVMGIILLSGLAVLLAALRKFL